MRISDWSSDVCSSDLRAMARMPAALVDAGLPDVKMLLQVHDELVFEAPEGQADAAGEIIRRVMMGAAEPALTLSVPLEVEIGTGKRSDERRVGEAGVRPWRSRGAPDNYKKNTT